MLYYVLIGLCLSLVGVAGLQLTYMFYLDRLDRERKKRIYELEHRCRELTQKLAMAQEKVDEQEELLDKFDIFRERNEEAWADLLEEN